MSKKGYKQTEKHIRNNRKSHKLNCLCCICKTMRGETKGKNSPNYKLKRTQKTKDKISKAVCIRHNSSERFGFCRNKYIGEKNGMLSGLISQRKSDNLNFIYIKANQPRMRYSRYIAEKYLKRKLTKEEVVHHINENKSDDKPENLYVFSTKGEHISYHRNMTKKRLILISNLS